MKSLSSTLYKFSNLTKKFSKYLKKFGFIRGIIQIVRLRVFPGRGLIYVSIPKITHPVIIRGRTTDVYIFEKIFILEDYNIPQLNNFHANFIIDGGAYVGYSSIFFANKFPDSTVVAVEPEKSNFSMLEKNTSQYKNIKRINAGIWNKNTFLLIKDLKNDDMGVLHYAFIVEEVDKEEANSVKAITISDILKEYKQDEIDILKLDIEGAEKDVFSTNFSDWLSRTKMIFIELHDFNKEGCTEKVYSATNRFNFTEILRDEENIYFLRKSSKCVDLAR